MNRMGIHIYGRKRSILWENKRGKNLRIVVYKMQKKYILSSGYVILFSNKIITERI